jgi:hypothetical protein
MFWNLPPDPVEHGGTPYEVGFDEGFKAGELAAMERIGRNVDEISNRTERDGSVHVPASLWKRLLQSFRQV